MKTEQGRRTLTREQVLATAVELADREGIDAVSMRRLGQELGIEAMSLYTHVRSKEDLLSGMVEVVFSEIQPHEPVDDWKGALRQAILDARAAMRRHPWAPAVVETRDEPGPVMLMQFDRVMGILRGGGFSLDMTHHAIHLLGSRGLGFTRELFDESPDPSPEQAAAIAEQMRPVYPHVAEMALAATHGDGLTACDTDFEFVFSLDVILDGLERLRDEA